MSKRRANGLFECALACVVAVVSIPRIAHVENLTCPNQGNLHRASASHQIRDQNLGFTESFTFDRDDAYQAWTESAASITSGTDYDITETTSVMAVNIFGRMSLASSHVAGVTTFNAWPLHDGDVHCQNFDNGIITEAEHYYDIGHSWQNLNDYRCTAIHELMHGIGFAHNLDTGSVMKVSSSYNHVSRCHGGSPVTALGAVDIADVNALY